MIYPLSCDCRIGMLTLVIGIRFNKWEDFLATVLCHLLLIPIIVIPSLQAQVGAFFNSYNPIFQKAIDF